MYHVEIEFDDENVICLSIELYEDVKILQEQLIWKRFEIKEGE